MATIGPQLRILRVKKKRTLPSRGKASEEQLNEILLVATPSASECTKKRELTPQLPQRNETISVDPDAKWLQDPIDPTEISVLRVLLLKLVEDLEGNDCFKDMGAYVRKVLGNNETSQSVELENKEREAEVMWKLRCTVTRITKTSLEGKNSNVYCMAGLLHYKHREVVSVMNGDLKDWFQHRHLGEISTTSTCSIAEDTPLCETIHLCVSKLPLKLLVLEVWQDKKKDGAKRRSLLPLLKTSDKFVGRIIHPFEKIPLEQETVTETLHSHSFKSERGDLCFQMRLVGNKTAVEPPDSVAILNGYRTLFRAIVKYESRKPQGDGRSPGLTRRWPVDLSAQAKQLLLTYATWNSMSVLQRATIQLSVLLQYHKHLGVEVDACTSLMGVMQEQARLREQVAESLVGSEGSPPTTPPYSPGTTDSPPPDSPFMELSPRSCTPLTPVEWPFDLQTQLAGFGMDLQATLGNHLVLLEDNLTTVEQLRRRLAALQKLYELRPAVGTLHDDGRTFQKTLECCVKKSIQNWFNTCSAQLSSSRVGRQGKGQTFHALCEACNDMYACIQKDLVTVFNLNGFDYVFEFLEFVDRELKELCRDLLSSSYAPGEDATRASISSYRAYLSCRKIGACGSTHGFKNKLELPLCCHQWFEPEIQNWFAAADVLCKERINKAIETDEVMKEPDEPKHSSSASRVTVCLMQMVSFWKNLDWLDYEVACESMLQMFEKMCSCVHYYVKKIHNRLTDKDLHDSSGKFYASEQLCVVFNNISHIKKQLDVVCQKLDVRNLCNKMEPGRGKEVEETFNRLKQSTRTDIEGRLLNTASHISEKLKPEIRKHICAWAKIPRETDSMQVFAPLHNYLADHLQILGDSLLDDLFQLVLANVWSVTVDCSLSALHKYPIIHQQLSNALPYVKQLFSAEGAGVSEETLNSTPHYKVLVAELELRQLPTRELVLRCCADLAEQQAKVVGSSEHKYGELEYSLAYIRPRSMVAITVVQVKNLGMEEHQGTQIQVWLLPQSVFKSEVEKSPDQVEKSPDLVEKSLDQVEKSPDQVEKLLDPFCNKQLTLPATEVDMRTDGSILLLGVFCGSGSKDSTRVCIISCKDVPILDQQPVANCSTSCLPLFVIQCASTGPLRELVYRHHTSDAEVSNFYQYLVKTLQVSVSISQ